MTSALNGSICTVTGREVSRFKTYCGWYYTTHNTILWYYHNLMLYSPRPRDTRYSSIAMFTLLEASSLQKLHISACIDMVYFLRCSVRVCALRVCVCVSILPVVFRSRIACFCVLFVVCGAAMEDCLDSHTYGMCLNMWLVSEGIWSYVRGTELFRLFRGIKSSITGVWSVKEISDWRFPVL